MGRLRHLEPADQRVVGAVNAYLELSRTLNAGPFTNGLDLVVALLVADLGLGDPTSAGVRQGGGRGPVQGAGGNGGLGVVASDGGGTSGRVDDVDPDYRTGRQID